MKVKRFWIIKPVKCGLAASYLMGKIEPEWHSFKLWGVHYTLLCYWFMQVPGTDILAALGYDKTIGKQDNLKTNLVLPHGQRDAYSLSSGISDLQSLIMLPKPIEITQPIWIKGHINPQWSQGEDGLFDIMVDIFYEGSVEIVDYYPDSRGEF